MMADYAVVTQAPDGTWPTAAADWIVFAAPGATLHPALGALLQAHAEARPDLDIVYGDEVASGPAGKPLLLCKPEFDATQLVAHDYPGLPIAVRAQALAVLGGPDPAAGSAAIYDLLLRAVAAGLEVGRMTEVLAINPPGTARGPAPDRLTAVKRALQHGDCEAVPGLTLGTVELQRRFDDPPHVTILVTGGPGAALLSSLSETDWPMTHLHVVAASDGPAGTWPFDVRTIAPAHTDPNQLWQDCNTEFLVFLDAGLRVHAPGWLRALMTFAADPAVGGVGARLLNPGGTIRHAGMACGAPGPYAFAGLPQNQPSYQDWAVVQREWSLVSGEAFATRRSVLQWANGLDPRYGAATGHADLCLRLRLLGYRIVYTPHAEFVQHGAAPGWDSPAPDDQARFLETWQHFAAHDPAYHPRLARDMVAPVPQAQDWWVQPANSLLNQDRLGAEGAGGVQPE